MENLLDRSKNNESDFSCEICGQPLINFTHKCLSSTNIEEIFGCVSCDNNCDYCLEANYENEIF